MVLSILAIIILFTQLEPGWAWFFIFWLLAGAGIYILERQRAKNLAQDQLEQNIKRDLKAWSEIKPDSFSQS